MSLTLFIVNSTERMALFSYRQPISSQRKPDVFDRRHAGMVALIVSGLFGIYALLLILNDPGNKPGQFLLNPHATQLEDPTGSWTIREVLSIPVQEQFRSLGTGFHNQGVTGSTYWLKVEVPQKFLKRMRRQAKTTPRWYLEFSRAHMNMAELYEVPRTGADADALGKGSVSHIRMQSADIRTPLDQMKLRYVTSVFSLEADQLGTYDFYLRLRNTKSLFGNLILYSPSEFRKKNIYESVFMGAFGGGVLLLIFYNINAFRGTREKVHLYYIGFIGFLSLLMFIELWIPVSLNQKTMEWIASSPPYLMWTTWLLGVSYCREHLNTKTSMPAVDRAFQLLMGIAPICMVITPVVSYRDAYVFTILASNICLSLAFYAGFIAMRQKNSAGYEFTAAWLVNLGGCGVFSAVMLGILEPGYATLGAGPVGVLLQGFIFSLSLSNRLEETTHLAAKERSRSLAMSRKYSRKLEREVEERTQALQLKTDELLDVNQQKKQALEETHRYLEKVSELINNAGEGFLSFGQSLAIEEGYSVECLRIFGRRDLDLPINELLAEGDHAQKQFLARAFAALLNHIDDTDSHELYIGLLPAEYRIGRGYYKAIYKPLKNKIMLTLKDVTEEKQTIKRMERERLSLEFIVYALDNRQEMVQVIKEFRKFLEETPARLLDSVDVAEAASEFNRSVHTFKSLFAQASAPSLPEALHSLETTLSRHLQYVGSGHEILGLFRQSPVERAFAADMAILTAKFGDEYLDDHAILMVELTNIDAMISTIQETCGHDSRAHRMAISLRHESLASLLEPHFKMAKKLADKQEKPLSINVIDEAGIRVDETRYSGWLNAMVHVFRNCVEHGLEFPYERVDAGKSEMATLRVMLAREDKGLRIEIEDDGRGIDAEALRAKLVSQKLMSPQDVAQIPDHAIYRSIFLDGVSSRKTVTLTAGRGVGLSAVKAEVDALGGEVEVFSEPGRFTRFVFRLPWLA